MKILHVSTGLGDGGAEAVLHRLCRHLPEHHHHVVSLGDEGKYGPVLRNEGVAVTALHMRRGRPEPGGLLRLVSLIRHERPDAVQCWMYHANLVGGMAARLAGVESVFWGIHHTVLDPEKSARSTRLVSRICALLSGRVPRRIVSCSRRGAEIHAGGGYAEDLWTVIPNGYDTRVFAPDETSRRDWRKAWGAADTDFVIGNVARWDADKDHANLLAALGRLKRRDIAFHSAFAGKGITVENRDLRRMIAAEDLGDRIRLLGPRDDIAAVINGFDLHVLASRGEAFPNVVAETMACGMPNAVTDVGDAAMIVGDTGWVVPPRNPEALADAIEAASREFAGGQEWRKRKAACRERIAANFTIETMARKYVAMWSGHDDDPAESRRAP